MNKKASTKTPLQIRICTMPLVLCSHPAATLYVGKGPHGKDHEGKDPSELSPREVDVLALSDLERLPPHDGRVKREVVGRRAGVVKLKGRRK
jgi:hypothetical protein